MRARRPSGETQIYCNVDMRFTFHVRRVVEGERGDRKVAWDREGETVEVNVTDPTYVDISEEGAAGTASGAVDFNLSTVGEDEFDARLLEAARETVRKALTEEW